MENILFTLSYKQSYCSACEQPKDLVFFCGWGYFKETKSGIWSSEEIVCLEMGNAMICSTHMHTHQILAFDMEITFTDSTTGTSVSIYTLSTKWSKGKVIWDGLLLFLWVCVFSFFLRLWQERLTAVHCDDRERVLDLIQRGGKWDADHRIQSPDIWWVYCKLDLSKMEFLYSAKSLTSVCFSRLSRAS